jgi:glycosyltransferase involved in cell wall biosynthesis
MRNKLTIVIPVYQNAGSIEATCRAATAALEAHTVDYNFVLVNDASTDGSWDVMQRLQLERQDKFTIIKFTRNFGQIAALLAGYTYADGDCIVSMAADMQDPPQIIAGMVDAWLKGHKLVVAGRIARDDGVVADFVSNFAWNILKRYAVPNLPKGGFDYFLMDKQIRDYFINNPEQHIFIQGRLLYYGCEPYVIQYERQKRLSGKSQTTFSRKLKYLIDGFIGYSFTPLRVLSITGIVISLFSIIIAAIICWYVLAKGSKVEGWASMMVAMLFLNGIQLMALGVIGEYLWRNIEESRKRPHYIIGEIKCTTK